MLNACIHVVDCSVARCFPRDTCGLIQCIFSFLWNNLYLDYTLKRISKTRAEIEKCSLCFTRNRDMAESRCEAELRAGGTQPCRRQQRAPEASLRPGSCLASALSRRVHTVSYSEWMCCLLFKGWAADCGHRSLHMVHSDIASFGLQERASHIQREDHCVTSIMWTWVILETYLAGCPAHGFNISHDFANPDLSPERKTTHISFWPSKKHLELSVSPLLPLSLL